MNESTSITAIFVLIMLFLVSFWVIGSYFVAKFAERAGRNFTTWMLLSLMISPIWMGLYIALKDYSGKQIPKKVSKSKAKTEDIEWVNPVAQYRNNKY